MVRPRAPAVLGAAPAALALRYELLVSGIEAVITHVQAPVRPSVSTERMRSPSRISSRVCHPFNVGTDPFNGPSRDRGMELTGTYRG